jgi:hypothetical protein
LERRQTKIMILRFGKSIKQLRRESPQIFMAGRSLLLRAGQILLIFDESFRNRKTIGIEDRKRTYEPHLG